MSISGSCACIKHASDVVAHAGIVKPYKPAHARLSARTEFEPFIFMVDLVRADGEKSGMFGVW